ncbi:MAG TPA: HAD-IA family hydrolase [Acidimicrobiia bacterium]|nr:HAD-IA family hydrolase [Acidimicrobiia bacterium]
MAWRAVIFDLGGVVLPSPLDTFRSYEASHGLPHRFLSEVVLAGGDDGAWSRFERGELDPAGFAKDFERECAAAGGQVDVAVLLSEVATGAGPRPAMLAALRAIRAHGLRTAALTNNWRADDGATMGDRQAGLFDLFDVVVESAVEGLRKPDPRIYELTCARVGVAPDEAVFLDDLGVNLKPARALGMATIKVSDPDAALAQLADVLGFALDDPDPRTAR